MLALGFNVLWYSEFGCGLVFPLPVRMSSPVKVPLVGFGQGLPAIAHDSRRQFTQPRQFLLALHVQLAQGNERNRWLRPFAGLVVLPLFDAVFQGFVPYPSASPGGPHHLVALGFRPRMHPQGDTPIGHRHVTSLCMPYSTLSATACTAWCEIVYSPHRFPGDRGLDQCFSHDALGAQHHAPIGTGLLRIS